MRLFRRGGARTWYATFYGNGVRDLAQACDRAGIEPCTPNDLRRTCATWLRQAGAAPDLIAP